MNSLKNDSITEQLFKHEYFHPFYNPMGLATCNVVESINDVIENDCNNIIEHHDYLKTCRLDFTLASLKRLDEILIYLFKNKMMENTHLSDDYKLDNLYFFLIAYVGECFARARGEAAVWFSKNEVKNMDLLFSSFKPASLFSTQQNSENDLILPNRSMLSNYTTIFLLLGLHKKDIILNDIDFFLPFVPILDIKADDYSNSLYNYVVRNLKAFKFPIPDINYALPDAKINLDPNIRDKISSLKPNQRYYIQMHRPYFIKKDGTDPLFNQYLNLENLYKEGRVVWAAVVQANHSMFLPRDSKKYTSLGEIVYDPYGRTHIGKLIKLAEMLVNLKNAPPDKLDQLSHHNRLNNGKECVFGADYPKSLSRLPIKVSSLVIYRKHLPNGLLSQSFFPILISDKCEGIATILPSRFWPKEFVSAWLDAAREKHNGNDYDLMPEFIKNESESFTSCNSSTDLYPKLTEFYPDHLEYIEDYKKNSLKQINSEPFKNFELKKSFINNTSSEPNGFNNLDFETRKKLIENQFYYYKLNSKLDKKNNNFKIKSPIILTFGLIFIIATIIKSFF